MDNTEEVYTLSTLEGERKEYKRILGLLILQQTVTLLYLRRNDWWREISIFSNCVEEGDEVRFEPVRADEDTIWFLKY